MAPLKTGLEYYQHYLGMTRDKKLRRIRLKYGSTGVDVWLTILDMIYEDKGYYIKYGSDSEKEDVVWGVLEYVKGKYAPTAETVAEIIEDLVACELFSGDLFKSGILSSKRIQLQYYTGTVERKTVEIIPEYWLLSVKEMKATSRRSTILHYFDNQPICEDNRPNSEDNQPIRKQSRVEKSKVEYSRVEESKAASPPAPPSRKSLAEKYGERVVSQYEAKYSEWQAKKGKAGGISYPTIARWLIEDGAPEVTSSMDPVTLQELREQYSEDSTW